MEIRNIVGIYAQKNIQERLKMRANAKNWTSSGSAERQVAGEKALAEFDRIDEEELQTYIETQRKKDLSVRVLDAFHRHPITKAERRIVEALLENPGSTSAKLTEACGYKGGSAWHLRFGIMCRDRRMELWPAPPSEVRLADFYSGILADWNDTTKTFTMKPDVARAFALLGIGPVLSLSDG